MAERLSLKYAGTPSLFAADLTIKSPAAYQVIVYIHDKTTGNTGVGKSSFIVSEG